MSTSGDGGATLSAVTWIALAPTSEEAAGSKPPVGRFRTSCRSSFNMAFMSFNSPFTLSRKSYSSLHTVARALSPALAFGRGPLEDDDRSQPDFFGIANSVSTSSCVGAALNVRPVREATVDP